METKFLEANPAAILQEAQHETHPTVEVLLQYFQKALKQEVETGEDTSVRQLDIAYAYFYLCWEEGRGQREDTDLTFAHANDFCKNTYYPREFVFWKTLFAASVTDSDREDDTKISQRAKDVHERAAWKNHFLPAIVTLIDSKWGKLAHSYGFALDIEPYVGKGSRLLDDQYGRALTESCDTSNPLFWQGLCVRVLANMVKLEDFSDASGGWLNYNDWLSFQRLIRSGPVHDLGHGVCATYGAILMPSIDAWNRVVAEHNLRDASQIRPLPRRPITPLVVEGWKLVRLYPAIVDRMRLDTACAGLEVRLLADESMRIVLHDTVPLPDLSEWPLAVQALCTHIQFYLDVIKNALPVKDLMCGLAFFTEDKKNLQLQ